MNDADAVKVALRGLGFVVLTCPNGTKAELKQAIKNFRESLTTDCLAIFYYAGYSLQYGGNNFIVPIDANVGLLTDIEEECLSLNWVLGSFSECPGQFALIVLEAARGNPFEPSWRSTQLPTSTALAAVTAPRGTAVCFSAQPGHSISFEYTHETCSVFTTALVEHIGNPGISVTHMLSRVQTDVTVATDSQQVLTCSLLRIVRSHISTEECIHAHEESCPPPINLTFLT